MQNMSHMIYQNSSDYDVKVKSNIFIWISIKLWFISLKHLLLMILALGYKMYKYVSKINVISKSILLGGSWYGEAS